MPLYTIGIDPGKKGGIAILCSDNTIEYMKMPEVYSELLNLVNRMNSKKNLDNNNIHCFIEQVQYRPQQRGVLTMITNYGRILGYLEAYYIPYTVVSSQRWKGHFKLFGKDKVESINLANQLFGLKLKKTYDGIAEALLIAKYGEQRRR